MLKNISSFLIFVVLVSGCDVGPAKQGVGKFGMLDSNLPEYAAIEFFDDIYHGRNLDGAIELSTPRMQRLLRSYHTNKGVQKHVLNMRFDEVDIQPSTNSAGRNEFAKDAKVSLLFEGRLQGELIKDMRDVQLIKIDNKWKIDEVSVH